MVRTAWFNSGRGGDGVYHFLELLFPISLDVDIDGSPVTSAALFAIHNKIIILEIASLCDGRPLQRNGLPVRSLARSEQRMGVVDAHQESSNYSV
jgi:hypothetical protein